MRTLRCPAVHSYIKSSGAHPHIHSFPTRRSSDLAVGFYVAKYVNKKSDMDLAAKGPYLTDRKSGSAGMPRPISYAVFCLKKKTQVGRRWNSRRTLKRTLSRLMQSLIPAADWRRLS